MSSLWLADAQRPDSTSFVPSSSWDTVVIGAGLTGLVTAVLLARAGQRVLVLEARRAGDVTTGNTTGKLSLLQGSRLSTVVSHHGYRVAAAYVDGNRAGQDWVLDFCQANGVAFERRDAWAYAGTSSGRRTARREFQTAQHLGLPVSWLDGDELPYRTFGAVRLGDQAQLDPLPLLAALAAELTARGGSLVEHQRVHQVTTSRSGVRVEAASGTVTADHAVVATGLPFLDRGLYFAKTKPQRSYAAAYRVPAQIPRGMYLSVDGPTRSLRTAASGGQELLLVGGNGHPVGRPPQSPSALVDDLDRWTKENFPDAEQVYRWSAQDYQSANSVPFAGPLPRSGGRIHVATGFGKWGMTNGPMAALMIAGHIAGDRPRWMRVLQHRISRPRSVLTGVAFNAEVGFAGARGWLGAELRRAPDHRPAPAEGQGSVMAERGRPVAVSTVGGSTCALSAVCTHLGGVVTWNDQEQSWDCPLHGSRFSAAGAVLEGPATRPLSVPG